MHSSRAGSAPTSVISAAPARPPARPRPPSPLALPDAWLVNSPCLSSSACLAGMPSRCSLGLGYVARSLPFDDPALYKAHTHPLRLLAERAAHSPYRSPGSTNSSVDSSNLSHPLILRHPSKQNSAERWRLRRGVHLAFARLADGRSTVWRRTCSFAEPARWLEDSAPRTRFCVLLLWEVSVEGLAALLPEERGLPQSSNLLQEKCATSANSTLGHAKVKAPEIALLPSLRSRVGASSRLAGLLERAEHAVVPSPRSLGQPKPPPPSSSLLPLSILLPILSPARPLIEADNRPDRRRRRPAMVVRKQVGHVYSREVDLERVGRREGRSCLRRVGK